MTTRHVGRLRLAGSLAAAGLLAAACGSSGGASAGGGSAGGGSAASGGESATVSTAGGPDGAHLVDAAGRALYLWTKDSAGESACAGGCASAWPPLTAASAPTAAGSAKAADLGTITRADGTRQVTYAGHPLYRFAGDGDGGAAATGQGSDGFGAKWWLVAPSGAAITDAPPASSASTASGGHY